MHGFFPLPQNPRRLTHTTLLRRKWACNDVENITVSEIGYQRVQRALRNLDAATFFGRINSDGDQRNHGRQTRTLQLLRDLGAETVFKSIDFGDLIQEVVLPSEYETRQLVLPMPPRYGDPCSDGYGLDNYGLCLPCAAGALGAMNMPCCTFPPQTYVI